MNTRGRWSRRSFYRWGLRRVMTGHHPTRAELRRRREFWWNHRSWTTQRTTSWRARSLTSGDYTWQKKLPPLRRRQLQVQLVMVRRNFYAQVLKIRTLKIHHQYSTGYAHHGPDRKGSLAAKTVADWLVKYLKSKFKRIRKGSRLVIRLKRYNNRSTKWRKVIEVMTGFFHHQHPMVQRRLRIKLVFDLGLSHNGMRPAKARRV